jgi:hypothetical protein
LRQQFRQARQEVDSLEDQLKEMEKKDTDVKEASNREKEDQLILERLGNQLKYNMEKLEEDQIMLVNVLQEEAAADAEENRQEVLLGEKLCELESVQNCVEGAQKVVVQMRTCSIREEEEVKGDMMAEMELGELMMLWVEEKTFFEN